MIKNVLNVRFSLTIFLVFAAVLFLSACSSDSSRSDEKVSQTQPSSDPNSMETDLTITSSQQVFVDDLLADKLTESEATTRIQDSGYSSRIGERNGEQFMLTMDYRNDRLTLTVVDDIVTEAYWG